MNEQSNLVPILLPGFRSGVGENLRKINLRKSEKYIGSGDKKLSGGKDGSVESLNSESSRLLSLDFFRGMTMFLLIGTLYPTLRDSNVPFLSAIGWQFEHRYWDALTFYDFIEPFFMFILGVAIPFSIASRQRKGQTSKQITKHALGRAVILFALGILIYWVDAGKTVFRLWNVLTQMSVGYLFAFLLVKRAVKIQILVSLLLLLCTDLVYRFWPVAGFNQPFIPDHNFGSWFDLLVMGVLESDHWVSFNFIPTTAFIIWGAIAGLILRGETRYQEKVKILLLAGGLGIIAGFALEPITPMIKRIATSSVVLETGGWCFITLALSYWVIDIKKIKTIPFFFAIVGMNPLFIYLFTQLGGSSFLQNIASPFGYALFFWANNYLVVLVTELLTWFMLWYICFWLYKRKIFIKI